MDISRRNHNKKGNKENAQPACGSKISNTKIVSNTVSVAPLHAQNNEKNEGHSKNRDAQKVKSTHRDTQSLPKASMKNLNTVHKNDETVPDVNTLTRRTLSRAFLTEQAAKQKNIIEAAKPSISRQHAKSTPGLYKGKVVQSKIGSIWKFSAPAKGGHQPTVKPSAAKVESRKVDNISKRRSKSVDDLAGRVDQRPKPSRSNSVSDGPLPVSKRPVTNRPPTRLHSAPPRTTTLAAASSSGTIALPKTVEKKIIKAPVTRDKKVNRPPVSSSLSQYRVSMESAEERKAKLADWLASKGKTLKRPAMATTQPIKTKVPIKSHVEPESAVHRDPECEPSEQVPSQDLPAAAVPVLNAAQPGENMVEAPASDGIITFKNASLELLEDSDLDLSDDPEDRVDDIVVNLCDALSALATHEDEPQQKDHYEMRGGTTKEDCQEDEADDKMPQNVTDGKEEVDTEIDQCSEGEGGKGCACDEDGEAEMLPTMEDSSSVKYNIKTTPYLQRVKKSLQGEVASDCGSTRRKSIKDLKFLTPVRRSSRIHRNMSRLPAMLLDHDPCVTSLAELGKLEDDAYIYRRNPALVKGSPEHEGLLSGSKYT